MPRTVLSESNHGDARRCHKHVQTTRSMIRHHTGTQVGGTTGEYEHEGTDCVLKWNGKTQAYYVSK